MERMDRVYADGGVMNDGFAWWVHGKGEVREIVDGLDCAIMHGKLYKGEMIMRRAEVPEGAIARFATRQKWRHGMEYWLPIERNNQYDRKYVRALENTGWCRRAGRYVMVGPRIHSNPYGLDDVFLERLYRRRLDCPRDYYGLYGFFRTHNVFGVAAFDEAGVPCGMVLRSEYGLDWPTEDYIW